jgi:hypothetical protein
MILKYFSLKITEYTDFADKEKSLELLPLRHRGHKERGII